MSYPVSAPGAPPVLPPRSAPQQIPACSVVFSGQHYPVCSVPPPVSVLNTLGMLESVESTPPDLSFKHFWFVSSVLLQVLPTCSVQHLPMSYPFQSLLSGDPAFLLPPPPHLPHPSAHLPHHPPHLPQPGQFGPYPAQQARSVSRTDTADTLLCCHLLSFTSFRLCFFNLS